MAERTHFRPGCMTELDVIKMVNPTKLVEVINMAGTCCTVCHIRKGENKCEFKPS